MFKFRGWFYVHEEDNYGLFNIKSYHMTSEDLEYNTHIQ